MSTFAELKTHGNAEYMGGQYAKAVASYSQALALGAAAASEAERATVLCNRAQCFLKTRENDKAAAALSLTGPGRVAIPTINAPDLQNEAAKQSNKA